MHRRPGKQTPAFSGRGGGGGRLSSLQARDAAVGGKATGKRQSNGRFKKTLNGNYMSNRVKSAQGSTAVDESNAKLQQVKAEDILEAGLGFPLFMEGPDRLGWLMNITSSCMDDKVNGQTVSAVDCFFMCQDGSMFKARVAFAPYFYIQVKDGQEHEVEGYLRRKFENMIREAQMVDMEDLDLRNHLSGLKQRLLKLRFWNVQQLMEVKREIMPLVTRNKARAKTTQAYTDLQQQGGEEGAPMQDVTECVLDIREYDVPYHVRFQIDMDIRCGHWFRVVCKDGVTSLERRADLLQRAEPRICAWDIETTKLPLQFPNAEYDQVFMISYMLDKQGYLITNREVVGADIANFEFTPKPEFEGPFIVFNEPNELAVLRRFFDHMRQAQPAIYVTYNGDFFDFPFIEKRCAKHGLDLHAELGFRINAANECLSRHAVHMDCLHWVNRDSYLPQGSRGLKAVTKAKLGYDPVEVHPEDMLQMAAEQPQQMASYSVSDAVSTYYLYMTYIHPFIFSLATIIPMPPDEVLRKGSGTLCEQLLMVQAFQKHIICPNKHVTETEVMYKGHLLESETYIGGKVEAIESGVFRADLPLKFKCKPDAYQGLIDKLDQDLHYAIWHEGKMRVEDLTNYEEVKQAICDKLDSLKNIPNR